MKQMTNNFIGRCSQYLFTIDHDHEYQWQLLALHKATDLIDLTNTAGT